MKSSWLWRIFLVAPLTLGAALSAEETAVEPEDEPAWGRLYLRNGLAPIQYFRDSFGGPMVNREVDLYFPLREEDRLGCSALPQAEHEVVRASKGSTVLVLDRGECTFETKSRVAQAFGAAGLIVVSQTDDVRGPVAIVDDELGPIAIPSVMIRQSAGQMLRDVAKREQISGWLMPMVCELHPYRCSPRTDKEQAFIEKASALSGFISNEPKEADSSTKPLELGPFLAATYGSILPTTRVLELAEVQDACAAIESAVEGKAVLMTAGSGRCSAFEQSSNAQLAGAAVAILVMAENETVMAHPVVKHSWTAYNISIPSVVVSASTATQLRHLAKDGAVRFAIDNQVAAEWEELRKLTLHTMWPVRKERRERLARRLLSDLSVFRRSDASTAVGALELLFRSIGGSDESWRRVVGVKQEAAGAGTTAASVGQPSAHEEL